MRRSLPRATAACAAYALVLSLGVAAPAAADDEAPATTGDASVSGQRSSEPGQAASADGGPPNPAGSDGASATGASPASARSGGGRAEAESSLWTYVDRAFPDRPHGGAETASVGTGRLAWDRVYTRRALFRFPVASSPGAVVDSAVLRTEVVWSYDCHSDSFMELHRVDPFHAESTWNDQPAARALLDTRRIRGGQAACPVSGGVEFDVTEAYQWAVDNGESHLHLRLAERDEAGSTAWRRFDAEDSPPVLAVEHSTPRTPGAGPASDPPGHPSGSQRGAEDAGPPGERVATPHEHSPEPSPNRSAAGPALPDDAVPADTAPGNAVPEAPGADDVRSQSTVSVGQTRVGGDRVRSRRGERIGRPSASRGHRRQGRSTTPQARGPPNAKLVGDRTPVKRPQEHG